MTERRARRGAASLLALGLSGCLDLAHGAGPHLGCGDGGDNEPRVEARRIAGRAQGVVRRESKHVLSVRTAQGVLRFKDEPPYDEPLDGKHHYFCDRRDGFVLLQVEGGSDFTGVLIDEADGKTIEAGKEVLFSNDRRAFFARVQPDGLDGEAWTIRAADGTPSWSGYSFIEQRKGEIAATLETPAWTDTGEFTATAQCLADDKLRWKVKLTKAGGKWQWLPKRACPQS